MNTIFVVATRAGIDSVLPLEQNRTLDDEKIPLQVPKQKQSIKIPKKSWLNVTSGKLSGHRWTRGFCHSWSTQVILMPLGEEKDTSLWWGVGPYTHTSNESLFISSLLQNAHTYSSDLLFFLWNSLKKTEAAKKASFKDFMIRVCTFWQTNQQRPWKTSLGRFCFYFFLERPLASVKKNTEWFFWSWREMKYHPLFIRHDKMAIVGMLIFTTSENWLHKNKFLTFSQPKTSTDKKRQPAWFSEKLPRADPPKTNLQEKLEMLIAPMVKSGAEPLGSMGQEPSFRL